MNTQISEQALLGRINRKLAHDWKKVRKCRRNSRSYNTLRDYYIMNTYRNEIIEYGIINLEELAKELKVL
jgi:hypothetical protein